MTRSRPRCRVWLVRHAESTANAAGELVGRRDPDLSERGRQQAGAAAALLAVRLSAAPLVMSSPARRATDTAEVIAGRTGAKVQIDSRLREVDFGDLEGVRFADLGATWPPRWAVDPDEPIPGGESYAEVGRRARASLEDFTAVASERGRDLVVVTHLGPLKWIVASALGGGLELFDRLHVGYATLTHLDDRGDRRQLVSFNVAPPSPAIERAD